VKVVIEEKHISKFFLALVKEGGQLSRTDLSIRVFGGNRTASKLDELLKAPLLCGLVVMSKERIRTGGRVSVRYVLTPAGWEIARAWRLPMPANRIAPEEVRRQLDLLVADGTPWAVSLQRAAGAWRAHQEQEKRKREEKAAADREKKQERERTHPEVRHPSAKRHRTAKDLSERARFIQSKIQERQPLPHPPTPLSSSAAPSPPVVPRAMRDSGPMGTGGFRTESTARLPAVSSVAQRPQSGPRIKPRQGYDGQNPDAEDCRIIRKATEHGFFPCKEEESPNYGKFLYNNSQWLAPKEWWEKMKSSFN